MIAGLISAFAVVIVVQVVWELVREVTNVGS